MDVIKKNREFQLIFEKGHSIQGKYLVVYFLRNSYGINRFGVCAGKKLGTAVRRNYAKRLLREAIRAVSFAEEGWDLLLVAKNPILEASFCSIIEEIEHIIFKVGLLALKKEGAAEDSR